MIKLLSYMFLYQYSKHKRHIIFSLLRKRYVEVGDYAEIFPGPPGTSEIRLSGQTPLKQILLTRDHIRQSRLVQK